MLITPAPFYIQSFPRADLASDASMLQPLPLREFGVFDAFATALPSSGASDDLGLYGGTHGTAFPYIGTGDVKTLGAVTRKARVVTAMRAEFVGPSAAAFVRLRAGMITTVASVSATIDVAAYKAHASDGGVITGSDLILTTAQSINSTTWADKDFELDTTSLSAGDELDILVSIAVNDASSVTAVIAGFRAFLGCTIRG